MHVIMLADSDPPTVSCKKERLNYNIQGDYIRRAKVAVKTTKLRYSIFLNYRSSKIGDKNNISLFTIRDHPSHRTTVRVRVFLCVRRPGSASPIPDAAP